MRSDQKEDPRIGGSSENCRIKSTGLVTALITSVYSLPIRNVTIEAALALDLTIVYK